MTKEAKGKGGKDYVAIPKMMGKTAVAVIFIVTALAFFVHFHVSVDDGQVRVTPRDREGASSFIPEFLLGRSDDEAEIVVPDPSATSDPLQNETIRIASFDLTPLNHQKLRDAEASKRIIEQIIAHDIVAIQGVESRSQAVLHELVLRINALKRPTGEQLDYAYVCDRNIGAEPVERYNAFIFNNNTVEVDRTTVRWIRDPTRSFRLLPLMAAFRAKGPKPDEAFTFTLVNVRVDSPEQVGQLRLLADVYRTVRDDGRGEDDIIMLGHLCDQSASLSLRELALTPAIGSKTVTTIDGTQSLDNILFEQRATVEFVGRHGVVPLLRIYPMDFGQACRMCESLPIWAEFSVYEGGQTPDFALSTTRALQR